jgi:hypothetical protein
MQQPLFDVDLYGFGEAAPGTATRSGLSLTNPVS